MASSFGGGPTTMKTESGNTNGQRPYIKQDPDAVAVSPSAHSDEDIYEDAGDLGFAGSEQTVFLSRLPKLLWDSWLQLDDEQEIKIGRIRIEGQTMDSSTGRPRGEIKRMSLLLNRDEPRNHGVPKEYNMHVTNLESFNTFVFNEKDLPGYTQYQPEKAPMHWLARKRQANRVEKRKGQSQYRRAVPKQTSIIGQVQTEVNCQPVENEEYQHISNQRALLALRPKQKTKLLDSTVSGNILRPGTMGATGDFSNFVSKPTPARRKGQLLKSARKPQNELIDELYQRFTEFQYWPLKTLRARTRQPEAYLKETLEMIAFQNKSGNHAQQWQLKPEAKLGTYSFSAARDEAAPEADLIGGSDGADSGYDEDAPDNDDVKMEG